MIWYEQSFGRDYLMVYKHRSVENAEREVRQMVDWLRLPRGAKVLDLCCGMGRHSLTLAEYGCDVTGIDLSGLLLDEARNRDTASRISWLQGDMRRVPLPGARFDAVFNLFTSFGYFDEDTENRQVLLEIERLLRPGGKWIVDFLNTDVVVSRLIPLSERREGRITIRESRSIEEGVVRKQIAVLEPDCQPRRYIEKVRLYTLSDFMRMLIGTSLSIDEVYGDYSGEPYSAATSPRLIMVGGKD